jgi:hypothetical protein
MSDTRRLTLTPTSILDALIFLVEVSNDLGLYDFAELQRCVRLKRLEAV